MPTVVPKRPLPDSAAKGAPRPSAVSHTPDALDSNAQVDNDASAPGVPPGFGLPDWRSPLPVRPLLAAIPTNATVKGFYVRAVARDLESFGHPMPDYTVRTDFSDYSMRAAAELVLLAAERMHGGVTQREGVRRVGWTIFPALLQMTLGRVMFGALGNDLHAIARAGPRGFEVTMSHAKCEIVSNTKQAIQLALTDYYMFPECFVVGILEGVLMHCGFEEVPVLTRVHSPSRVDFLAQLAR